MKLPYLLLCMSLLASTPALAEIPSCKGGGPGDAIETARDFSICMKGGTCAGLHQMVFANTDSALPKAKKGYEYREARVGADNAGNAGNRRLVFLVGGNFGTRNASVEMKYFTDQHYASGSFCSLP